MSDSVRPHRRQPTRLPHPWDSPRKNPGVGCHFLLQCMKVKSESEVAQSCPILGDPMDCSLPGSSVHGIFQQEYWSGVPLPSRQLYMSPRATQPTLKSSSYKSFAFTKIKSNNSYPHSASDAHSLSIVTVKLLHLSRLKLAVSLKLQ